MNKYKSLSATLPSTPCKFSVCSIVSDIKEFELMKQSFEDCDFTVDCEFIIADNCDGNKFDSYNAIARFAREAAGKYLLIVHQDVRCIDKKAVLEKCLDELTLIDSKWAVCGNAGAAGYHRQLHYLDNAGKIMKNENLPARVNSLDENFLILNNSKQVAVSADLGGFHLYGTDLCITADFLGYTCYVIPFMVKHMSLGNLGDLKIYKNSFITAYGKKFRSRFIETTCTKFYLSNSAFKNTIYNSAIIFFFIKTWQRIKLLFKRLFFADPHRKIITKDKNQSA